MSKKITKKITKKTKTKAKKENWLDKVKNSKRAGLIIFGLVFAIIGLIVLRQSNAQTDWQVVWSDEFNGSSINTSNWGVYNNTYGDGNKEEACLTPNNLIVSNGTLKIQAKKENVTCPGGKVRDFSSGFISTRSIGSNGSGTTNQGKFFPKFAKYEMRAKLPHGQGLWPAFWLRHKNGAAVAEVDIMEYFHSQVPGKTTTTLHLDTNGSVNRNLAKKSTFFENTTDNPQWHTWSVEIQPDTSDPSKARFDFKLNGVTVNAVTPSQQNWGYQGDVNSMFDIAVNLAVGGNWSGHPDDELGWSRYLEKCIYGGSLKDRPCGSNGVRRANLPEAYEIDYVRVSVKQEAPTPPPPTQVSDTLTTPQNIKSVPSVQDMNVSWDPVTYADNYTVRWRETGGTWIYSNDLGKNPITNTYKIPGLKADTTYEISVAARDSTNKYKGSSYSAAISSKTQTAPISSPTPTPTPSPTPTPTPTPTPQPTVDIEAPTAPTDLLKSLTANWGKLRYELNLRWQPSADNVGVAGYEIYRNNKSLTKTTSTNFKDSSAKAGTKYTYGIQAYDAAGNRSSILESDVKVNCFLFVCTIE